MRSRLLYLVLGARIGAGGHYTYRQLNPELTMSKSARELIESYTSLRGLEKGYLVQVMRGLGIMLKGFYHYGMINKLEGFNYIASYLDKEEVHNSNLPVTKLFCIFSPNEWICGHPDIQHGGATATILDQNMGELAMLHSKEMVATADIFVKYKKPIKKGLFYVVEAIVVKREGRKIWVASKIKDVETGNVHVESEALFMTVNWNNRLTNVLSGFFQAINYKDYAEEKKLPHLPQLPHLPPVLKKSS